MTEVARCMSNSRSTFPRAIVHTKILDVAKSHPDASLVKIAEEVSGAPVDLVDRVLAEYGDPAQTHTQANNLERDSTMAQEEVNQPMEEVGFKQSIAGNGTGSTETRASVDNQGTEEVFVGCGTGTAGPEATAAETSTDGELNHEQPEDNNGFDIQKEDLLDEQLETVHQIYQNPTATQRDIAEELSISASAVNHRLSKIDGFEWKDRWQFVEEIFGPQQEGEADSEDGFEQIVRRLDEIEERIEANDLSQSNHSVEPELAHKIIHTCIKADELTKDEEIRIIRVLTQQ